MKHTLAILVTLTASVFALAQDETPLTIPAPKLAPQPVTFPLPPKIVAELGIAVNDVLAKHGSKIPDGVTNYNIRVITSGSNAGGGVVTLR